MESFWYDTKVALRLMRNRPAFSFAVAGMLALGVAGNAAIFSIFNGLFLRPLPFAEPVMIGVAMPADEKSNESGEQKQDEPLERRTELPRLEYYTAPATEREQARLRIGAERAAVSEAAARKIAVASSSRAELESERAKAAAALLHIASLPEPPLRLLLGSDAYDAAQRHASEILASDREWKALTTSTDFS